MKWSVKKMMAAAGAAAMVIGISALAVYLKHTADYKRVVREMSIGEVSVSDIPDGVYTGECDVNFIYAKVEVTVQGGEITNICILEHKNGRGRSAEAVVGKIVAEQKIDVDAVSGATNSSKVLKKAVENALKKGHD